MYARDNPRLLRVFRPDGLDTKTAETAAAAAWADVLIGDAKSEYMADVVPPEAVMAALRGRNPIVSRGPLPDTGRLTRLSPKG